MRQSKSRSRNKNNNRNRPSGNIVNRVFDSSGPEGKVRGTPQQIIDKYNQLARDAQLSNDRVATENFQQHAEHYLRMLAEAQREQAERQQQNQQNQQNQNNQQNNQNNQNNNQNTNQPNQNQQPPQNDTQGGNDGGGNDQRRSRGPRNQPRADRDQPQQGGSDVIDVAQKDSGLVETPEEKPKRQRKPRKPVEQTEGGDQPRDTAPPDAAE